MTTQAEFIQELKTFLGENGITAEIVSSFSSRPSLRIKLPLPAEAREDDYLERTVEVAIRPSQGSSRHGNAHVYVDAGCTWTSSPQYHSPLRVSDVFSSYNSALRLEKQATFKKLLVKVKKQMANLSESMLAKIEVSRQQEERAAAKEQLIQSSKGKAQAVAEEVKGTTRSRYDHTTVTSSRENNYDLYPDGKNLKMKVTFRGLTPRQAAMVIRFADEMKEATKDAI